MAVTRASLAVSLRVAATATDTIADGIGANLDRVLASAQALVAGYLGPDTTCPEAIQDEAVVRIASRLYDQSGHESRGGNVVVQSGAVMLLAPYKARRVAVGDGTATVGNGGVDGLDTSAVLELLSTALVQGSNIHIVRQDDTFIISASGNISSNDSVARAAATNAQAAANAAQNEVDALETVVANLPARRTDQEIDARAAALLAALSGGRVFIRVTAMNVAMDVPAGAKANDVVLELVSGTLSSRPRTQHQCIGSDRHRVWSAPGSGGAPTLVQRATVAWHGTSGAKQALLAHDAALPSGPWLVAIEETDASNEVARSALFGPGYGLTALASEVDKSVVFPFNARYQSGSIVGPVAWGKIDWRRETSTNANNHRMTVELQFVSGQSPDAGGYTARLYELVAAS